MKVYEKPELTELELKYDDVIAVSSNEGNATFEDIFINENF